MKISGTKLLVCMLGLLSCLSYADNGRNQGAVNNLCQNLTAACKQGDKQACQAAKETGCLCNATTGTCTRGNYSNSKG